MQVQLSEDAEADLLRIYLFNATRSLDWAERVELRLLQRAEILGSTPRTGRRIGAENVRRLSVADIQYVIDYRIATDRIEILRFQSTREIR